MRKQVQYRLRRPPRLIVEERIFREATGVDNPVLRADIWPAIGGRLAAIVESRPYRSACQPLPRIAEAPPTFRRCAARGGVRIIRTNIALLEIRDVNPAC